jgi:hypothetical protein
MLISQTSRIRHSIASHVELADSRRDRMNQYKTASSHQTSRCKNAGYLQLAMGEESGSAIGLSALSPESLDRYDILNKVLTHDVAT